MKNLFIPIVILILSFIILFLLYQNRLLKVTIDNLLEKKSLSQTGNESDSLNNLKKEKLSIDNNSENEKLKKYLKSILHQNNMAFIPDIIPINGDYVISQKFSKKHPAYDFAAEIGTEVIASASGFVYNIHTDEYFGKTILLDHLNGYKTKYSHLVKILVKENSFIKKGEVIGLVGNSGRSTAPHLHFEIIKATTNINPNKMIKGIDNAVIQK